MIPAIFRTIRRRLLTIDASEVSCCKRGFRPTLPETTQHIESIGQAFLEGFHRALDDGPCDELGTFLSVRPALYRGFAYEGAGMATWLLDALSFSHRARWDRFTSSVATKHPYVAHVGVGWALARLPWLRRTCERHLLSYDPLLRWLILDGYGFHEGYFKHRSVLGPTPARPTLTTYSARVFDQGLGRSLWFVEGADVVSIANRISTLDISRHPDFWSGVGLACAYAGPSTVPEIEFLMASSGGCLPHLAQGVTFGAEARVRGNIDNSSTDRVCMTVCGLSAVQAAELTQVAKSEVSGFDDLPELPRYERWRSRIRELLQEGVAV